MNASEQGITCFHYYMTKEGKENLIPFDVVDLHTKMQPANMHQMRLDADALCCCN